MLHEARKKYIYARCEDCGRDNVHVTVTDGGGGTLNQHWGHIRDPEPCPGSGKTVPAKAVRDKPIKRSVREGYGLRQAHKAEALALLNDGPHDYEPSSWSDGLDAYIHKPANFQFFRISDEDPPRVLAYLNDPRGPRSLTGRSPFVEYTPVRQTSESRPVRRLVDRLLEADLSGPMEKRYQRLRADLDDRTLLMLRLGDFYEFFHEDARKAAKILNITLTKRRETPMAGVPVHAVDTYTRKLMQAGYSVAISDTPDGELRILSPGRAQESLSPQAFGRRLLEAE